MPERTDEDTSQQVESLTPQAGPNEDEAIQGGSVSGVEEEIRWPGRLNGNGSSSYYAILHEPLCGARLPASYSFSRADDLTDPRSRRALREAAKGPSRFLCCGGETGDGIIHA